MDTPGEPLVQGPRVEHDTVHDHSPREASGAVESPPDGKTLRRCERHCTSDATRIPVVRADVTKTLAEASVE